jgi:hypothetical protein
MLITNKLIVIFMEMFIENLKGKIDLDIQLIESAKCEFIKSLPQIISVWDNAFKELKTFISGYAFKDEDEEIRFFKELKPQMCSQLVYYNDVYNIEKRMPKGNDEDKKAYLENLLGQVKSFFEKHFDFFNYYTSECDYMDKFYFLRDQTEIQLIRESFYYERDRDFSTGQDFIVSRILAGEMLLTYLKNKLAEIGQQSQNPSGSNLHFPEVRHTWTGKKIYLIEFAYGLKKGNYIDYGNISIKELISYLEDKFNVDLGDYYHAYLQMKNRKGSRTPFTDKLKKDLEDGMNESEKD